MYFIGDTTLSKFTAANPAGAVVLNTTVGNSGTSINGLGYNVLDGFLYGTIINGANSLLVRISGTGTSVVVTPLAGITGNIRGGDIDANGIYWVFTQVSDSPVTTWYSFNLNPAAGATYGLLTASGTSVLAGYNAYDWAIANNAGRLVSLEDLILVLLRGLDVANMFCTVLALHTLRCRRGHHNLLLQHGYQGVGHRGWSHCLYTWILDGPGYRSFCFRVRRPEREYIRQRLHFW